MRVSPAAFNFNEFQTFACDVFYYDSRAPIFNRKYKNDIIFACSVAVYYQPIQMAFKSIFENGKAVFI